MPYHYDPSFSAGGDNATDCGYGGYDCYANWPSPAPSPAVSPSPATSPAVSPSPAQVPSPAAIFYAAAAPGLPFPASPLNTGSKPQLLRTIVIVVSAVLATCAVLLTYYAVVRRYRSQRRRGTALAAQQAAPQPPPAPADDDLHQDLLAAAGGGEGDPYHVWHIRTVGLDEGTIGAIAAVAYRRGEGLVDGTDCAVCLGEFRDGEMLRLLPKCSHAFHIPCIDTWLRSHLNCPLCRAPILCPSPAQPLPSAANPEPPFSSPSSFTAAGAVDRPGSSEESDIWIPIELGNGGSEDEGGGIESDAPPEIDRGNRRATPQQVRRSVSMDPSALGALLRRMGLVGAAVEDGRRKPTSEAHPSAARDRGGRGSCCRAQPLEMGRSASSGGGGESFLSRFSGRTRGAIPPV